MDSWLAFATPVKKGERRGWISGAERGALYGLASTSLGSLPAMLLYLWVHWDGLPFDAWRMLMAQALTFVALTGALWGASVGAFVGRIRGGAMRFAVAGAVAGALGCVPSGAIGAMHFGQMSMPYFGGAPILLSAFATIMIAGVLFVKLAHRAGPAGGALRLKDALACTLAASPLLLVLAVPLLALDTAAFLLQLEEMRLLAGLIGLAPLGIAIAASMGAFGGAWMGLTVSRSAALLLARRRAAQRAPHRVTSDAIGRARARHRRDMRRLG